MTKLEEVLQQINEYGIADEVKSAILTQEDNKNTKKKNKDKIHAADRNTETAISAILYKYSITPIGNWSRTPCLVVEKNTGAISKDAVSLNLGYWGGEYHYNDFCFQPFFYVQ